MGRSALVSLVLVATGCATASHVAPPSVHAVVSTPSDPPAAHSAVVIEPEATDASPPEASGPDPEWRELAASTATTLPTPDEARAELSRQLDAVWGAVVTPPAPFRWYRGAWSVELGGRQWSGAAAVTDDQGLLLLGDGAACRLTMYVGYDVCGSVSCGESVVVGRQNMAVQREGAACPTLDDTVRWRRPLETWPPEAPERGQLDIALRAGSPTVDRAFALLIERAQAIGAFDVLAQRLRDRHDGATLRLVSLTPERDGTYLATVRSMHRREVELGAARRPESFMPETVWIQERIDYESTWRIGPTAEASTVEAAVPLYVRRELCQRFLARTGIPQWRTDPAETGCVVLLDTLSASAVRVARSSSDERP